MELVYSGSDHHAGGWLVRLAAAQTACDRLDRREGDRSGSEDRSAYKGGGSENFYPEPENYVVTGYLVEKTERLLCPLF